MEEQYNGMSPKTIAIISHLTIIGWVFALIKYRDEHSELSAFYIRQTLGITLLGIVVLSSAGLLAQWEQPPVPLLALWPSYFGSSA
jgi:hypothetical protein